MCTTGAVLSVRASSATGAFIAADTLPCACEMAPTLKSSPAISASKLRILNCVRWYRVPRTPTNASARGPIWPVGTPDGSTARCALPQPVQTPLNMRYSWTSGPRNVEHLVAQRSAFRDHRGAAFAYGHGVAVVHAVDFSFGHQRAKRSRVTLLRAAFAQAGPTLSAIATARTVRRRRLG
jgi:hypothetical protein